MSSASNLGYSRESPYNLSSSVNGTSTTYSGNFSSNEIPKSNISIKMGGMKKKIKNIVKHYKTMKGGKSRKIRAIKRKLKNTRYRRQSKRHRRRYRGGYSQYQNNMPFTPGYQAAGIQLSSSESALANPVPITRLGDQVNGIDNYNHYTNTGFPSRGH